MMQGRLKRIALALEVRPALVGTASTTLFLIVWSVWVWKIEGAHSSLVGPMELVRQTYLLATDGYGGTPLSVHIAASLFRTGTGFFAGATAGICVGIVMGYSPIVSSALGPFFSFVRPIPPIAYIPLVILWFGIGEFSKIILIFLASFLYVALNTAAGVRAVPQEIIRVARTFGTSDFRLLYAVILPEALPYVMLGLKVALALSWAIVVAAELVAAQAGLGYLIMDAGTFFRIPDLYVGIVLIGLIGLLLERGLTWIEHRFVHWSGK
ncbi:ABC transporter permease [Tardiphaga robiniae]|uniref:ABC transporter permease n=1 Tax=Tardiphaga robiniae TaxID=943830 RepID=A0A7G6TU00_9BRAD|nr:ABC transporter permease [Tardiphaga robiniae]QND70232.1 ABC transporter permease [Tardiphaga robiniae]